AGGCSRPRSIWPRSAAAPCSRSSHWRSGGTSAGSKARSATPPSGRGSLGCCSSTWPTSGPPSSASTSTRTSSGARPAPTASSRRRPGPSCLVPVVGLVVGIGLSSLGPIVFWRCLAYLAVFHFVRQQYGWVMLYRARCGERDRAGRLIDSAAIYLATIYPLVHWHAHLPRKFWWFLKGDFGTIPQLAEQLLEPIYWPALGLYFARSIWRRLAHGFANPGKDLVVLTTALCWYVGIVTFNSDYAFTVTNVVIHGVPYLVLIYWYAWVRKTTEPRPPVNHTRTLGVFIAVVWALAFAEELLWDKFI